MIVTPARYGQVVELGPWKALREQEHVEFALTDMPPGAGRAVCFEWADVAVILVDRSLSPADRLAALAHELVHLRRGGSGFQPGLTPELRTLVAREERRVEYEAATWIVPAAELTIYVDSKVDLGEPVEAWQVAEEFGVPDGYAEMALDELRRSA